MGHKEEHGDTPHSIFLMSESKPSRDTILPPIGKVRTNQFIDIGHKGASIWYIYSILAIFAPPPPSYMQLFIGK